MDISTAKIEFSQFQRKAFAYQHALGMLSYDSETCMPRGASENLGETIGVLSQEIYKLQTSQELTDILSVLKSNISELDSQTKKELEEIMLEREKIEKIPMDEFAEYEMVKNAAQQAWQTAKANNDYESFKPSLQKIIEINKKFAKYVKPEEENIYNTMLDDFERGITTDVLDDYFAKIKVALVPLIAKIKEKPAPRVDFLFRNYPAEGQRKIASYLMDVLCIDKNHCAIGETEHPFSTNFTKHDVRITTHYKEDNLASSFFSVIHEGGHGLYELNTGDELAKTVLGSGTSMGVHESQSRFWENIVGRSLEFCKLVFPKLQEIFPEQLSDVTAEEFYAAVNKVESDLIRIEADELTYSMHIMIRYEIEKQIMSGALSMDELPAVWNKLYKEYLGVEVPDDTNGILQDVHWSLGYFGYFPSYSIGSAYSAQITAALEKDLNLNELISKGDLSPILEWLTERIYKHGKMLSPSEVIQNCCGEDFDPKYYVEYLTNKYSKIYGLN